MSKRGFVGAVGRVLCGVLVASLLAQAPVSVADPSSGPGRPATELPPLPSDASAPPARELPTGDLSVMPPRGGLQQPPVDSSTPGFVRGRSTPVSHTATSTTYHNPDGTKTFEAHAAPINFKDRRTGQWRRFDNRLVPDGPDHLRQASGPVPVRVARATGQPIVTVGDQDWSLGFRLDGAPPGRTVRSGRGDRVAHFDDLGDGIALEYHTEGDLLKEQVVLTKPLPPGRPSTFRFPLQLKGLEPEAGTDGTIRFRHGGQVVAEIPPGFATDSRPGEDGSKPDHAPVETKLVKTGANWRIDVSVAREWLEAPGRVYPVYIDPTLDLGRDYDGSWGSDAFIGSGCADCTYSGNPQPGTWNYGQIDANAYVDKIGKTVYNGGNWEFYSYVYYDLGPLRNHTIQNASWNGYFYNGTNYGNNPVYLYPVGDPWNANTLTARTAPNHYPEYRAGSTYGPDQWLALDVSDFVRNWTTGARPNYGFAFDTAGIPHYHRMAAVEQAWADEDSYIHVQFSDRAATPGSLQGPAAGATLMTTTPTLSAAPSTDADGDPLSYYFRIGTTPDGEGGRMVNSVGLGSPSFTVPAGALQDGETYYWKVYTWDNWQWSVSEVRNFTLDLRLGSTQVSPQDAVGSVGVNLANGNAHFSVQSPTFETVNGPLGLSYSYNSLAPSATGLDGDYVEDCDRSTNWQSLASRRTTRRDPNISFDWGGGSPVPGSIDPDDFCVRWTGWVTAPRANRYCFLATNDDGVRVWVRDPTTGQNRLVVDNWAVQDNRSPSSGSVVNNCIDTTLDNQATPITVEYFETYGGAHIELWVNGPAATGPIPSSWLSPSPPVLPQGWTLSLGATNALAYAAAAVNTDSVTLVDVDGGKHEYRRTAAGQDGAAGFAPPPGEDSVMTMGQDGTYGSVIVVTAADGATYTFTSSGKLVRAESSAESSSAASYGWDSATGKLNELRDTVSGRAITLRYSPGPYAGATNPCPTGPNGFQAVPPPGMLCKVDYWDGTSTVLHYVNDSLARIQDPGGEVTDFGYADGRITRLRDPLGADKVASNPANFDNDTTRTLIAYDGGGGRTGSVTLPVPNAGSTPAEPRPAHSFGYAWASGTAHVNGGTTDVQVSGHPQPNGYTRRVVFDNAGRLTADRDTGGLLTTSTWDNDRLVGRTDAAGLRTTNVFDHAERPVETWGPAPASCFGTSPGEAGWRGERPTSCSVPKSETKYDEGMKGLAAVYWSNKTQAGKPVLHATGVGDSQGRLLQAWGTGAPAGVSATGDNWSARFTGDIHFPTTGTYSLELCADDGIRLFVNDERLLDDFTDTTSCRVATGVSAVAGERKRVRIDYKEAGGSASIDLLWAGPGIARQTVPGQYLAPRYGLATSNIDPDNKKRSTEYAQPEYALPLATVQDPAGLNLRTTTTYESAGTGYFRRTQQTLPRGSATTSTYTYYLGNELAPTNDCGIVGVPQGGLLKQITEADPDGAGVASPIVRQFLYDARGRTAGSRVVGDSRWKCTAYDARGRVTASTDRAGATTTFTYPSNSPETASATFPDSAGTFRSTSSRTDLVGRGVSYTDEHGTVTRRTYDQVGRPTGEYRTLSGGSETTVQTFAYDGVGRPASTTEHLSGSPRTTTYGYDSAGRPTTTTRPNGLVTTAGYDAASGGVSSIAHGSVSTWSYTRSLAGRVTSEATTGRNRAFTYDGAGRLTRAVEGTTTRNYAWDPDANRCARGTSCDGSHSFDNADRLTSSPDHSLYEYDAHGNMWRATPRTQPGPVAVADSYSFDAASPQTPRTYNLAVGQSGTVSATLDWANTGTAVTTGSDTGTLGVSPASATLPAMTGPRPSDTELKTGLSWDKALHRPTDAAALSVPAAGSATRQITTHATGDIIAALDWAPTPKSFNDSGSVSNTPTATTAHEGTLTVSGNGRVRFDVRWPSQPVNPDLDVMLIDDATGDIVQVANGTNAVDAYEPIDYEVTGLSGYPASRTYRYRITAKIGSASSFTITNGTYPVTATMDFRLENASGTVVASSTQVPNVRRRTLNHPGAPAATYVLRALSSNHAATPTTSATYSRLDWADISLALKKGTTTLASTSSSGGQLNLSHLVQQASSSGTFTWVLTNNSPTLTVPSFTASKTLTALGTDTTSGSILPTATATRAVTADGAGFTDVALSWSKSVTGSWADLTLQLKDASGGVVAQTRSSTGTATLTTAVPASGNYSVVIVNNSLATDVPSYTVTTRVPQKPPVGIDMALKDPSGATVATATGTKPKTISYSATPGAYTLVVTPSSGKADMTLSGSHPDYQKKFQVAYDANNHATRIEDGRSVIAETLSPSGRVLRRLVTDAATGAVAEDTVFGYDGAGDSPSYSRPTGGGTVTTYLDGVVYTGTTAAWHLTNGHGDVVGTVDSAGAFSGRPATDEFGMGEVAADRRGWLGGNHRLNVGGRLGLIRMGVRLYDTTTGRFMQADPVEGGSCSEYDYVCGDPVNGTDLDGEKMGPHQAKHCALPWNANKCRRASKYRRTAISVSLEAKRKYGLNPGQVNTLRHALYAALLAKNNGAGFARAHLHAHEQDNDAWFSFGSDGDCKGDRLRRDTEADKINNEIGISFGEGYKGKDKTLISNMVYAARTNLDGWAGFDYGSPCG